MTKYILKDKLEYPISFTLVWGVLEILFHKNNWTFLLLAILFMALLLCLFTFSKNDNYIQKTLIENESINIQYQKNFVKDQPHIFTTDSVSIESYKFNTNTFFGASYSVSIKFIDEENLYDSITFKTNNDAYFIDLISQLKKIKTKHINA